ncbi:MAG: hypothetical protein JFAIHJKO_02926 [Pyrinomonadaceae bacterium]|nr:hypothetical protein [Pyrinomonadaceae bacterium]
MGTDKNGYFINDTGRSLQELVTEAKSVRQDALYLFHLDDHPELPADRQEHIVLIHFPHLCLTDTQILEIDPNEPVCVGRRTRKLKPLKDTVQYKRAKKQARKNHGEEKNESDGKASTELQKAFDEWKVEPSKPVDDITDIFKEY